MTEQDSLDSEHRISWTGPSHGWLLDYAWAVSATALTLSAIPFAVLLWRGRLMTVNARVRYATFNVLNVLGLLYVPASEFLANYYCGTKPDASEVDDIFGTGVYFAWVLMAVGSFLQYSEGCAGVFSPPSGPPAHQQQPRRPDRGTRRYRVTRFLREVVACLGGEELAFFLTTLRTIVYYVVKMREGASGPVIEAPARMLTWACVLTSYLALGSLDFSRIDYTRYDGPSPTVVAFGFIIHLSIMTLFPPGRDRAEVQGQQLLRQGIKPNCQYWYSIVPPSGHGLDQWGQALALVVASVTIVVRLVYRVEKAVYRFADVSLAALTEIRIR
ncbi:hypothetical protein OQA88_3185 [Cercophora sp. LCS_1]